MFGVYNIPLKIENDGLIISIDNNGKLNHYKREYEDENLEKDISSDKSKILIHPVEPLNIPKEITSNFLIEFANTLMVEPQGIEKIYLKFPIEIGIFVSGNNDIEIIDILTFMPQKYALYGDSRNGVICKYWNSEIYSSVPDVNHLQEGVMELIIRNRTNRWVEVTRAVFNAFGMKIYFNEDLVSMKANIKILGEEIAETYFINSPIKTGMKKSMELYAVRKILIPTTRFLMEWGI